MRGALICCRHCSREASEDGSLTCKRCWLRTCNSLPEGEEYLSELRRERKRVEVVEVPGAGCRVFTAFFPSLALLSSDESNTTRGKTTRTGYEGGERMT